VEDTERKEDIMSAGQGQGSEVARILALVQAEYESAMLGLSGLAYGTSRHEFITRKMEKIGTFHKELQTMVGERSAMALIAEQLSGVPETKSSSVPSSEEKDEIFEQ
jgi:hypothetical protein